jgi:S1-C subfamily serine protease
MNRPTQTQFSSLLAAFVLAAGFLIGPAVAEDSKLREDFKKLLDSRQEKFLGELLKIIDQRVEARLAKLEEEVKSRDQIIADLKAKVAELSKAPEAPTAPPAVAAVAAGEQAFLGVKHTDVPADLGSKLSLDGGALVTRVLEKSPAAGAGLQAGDIILAVNGGAVTFANLTGAIEALKPDQEVEVTYLRDGNKVTKKAKLITKSQYEAGLQVRPVVLGVTVHEDEGKLIVEEVEAGLTASVAGLAVNDVLTSVNGTNVTTIPEIEAALAKIHAGEQFQLGVQRGDEALHLEVVGADGAQPAKLVTSNSDAKKPGVLGVTVVPSAAGIEVEVVEAGGAAAAGGVQKGDIVKEVNGKAVAAIADLKAILTQLSAGDKIALVLVRGDGRVKLKDIALQAMGPPQPAAAAPVVAAKPAPVRKGKLGFMAAQAAGPQLVVRSVDPGSPAEKGELQVADVILSVNGKEVKSFSDLESALTPAASGDALAMRVKRGNEEMDLTITLD